MGRRDEPTGWSGLAHLTEHLLFQGTPAAPGELITRLERLGAVSINGQTSDDWTRYFEVVPQGHLERTLWLEAERFAHGLDDVDDESVSDQVRVVDRERETRELGREGVWQLVNSIIYPEGHPYAGSGEEQDDVHAIHAADLRWFFQRNYMPDQMTVSLSGGFDPAQARTWIERYFGPLRRGAIEAPPAMVLPPPVEMSGERRVLAEARRADDLLCVIWPSPAWGAPGDAELDYVARELRHRLWSELVRDGTALTVNVRQERRGLASTFLACIEVPRRSGTLTALQALNGAVAEFQRAPMSDAALQGHQDAWMETTWLDMDSSLTRAQQYAQHLPAFPNGVYDLQANQARYRAVTAEGAQQAAQRYLLPHDRLVVSLAGRLDAPAEGRIISDVDFVQEAE